jgi:hypothetical protein
MSGLIELKKFMRMIQRTSDQAAIFCCEKCHMKGGMQRSHAGNANSGRRTAEEYRGYWLSPSMVALLIAGESWMEGKPAM